MFNPDLVKTLRICERDQAVDQLMNDAADEIDRLREENAKLRRLNPDLTGYANGYADAMEDAPDPVFSDADAAFMVEMGRKEIEKLRKENTRLVNDKVRLRHVLNNLICFAQIELPEPFQYAVREAKIAWAQTSDKEPPDVFGAKKIAREIIKSQSTSRTNSDAPPQSPTLNEPEEMCGNCCNWQHTKQDQWGPIGFCESKEEVRYADYNDCQDFKLASVVAPYRSPETIA